MPFVVAGAGPLGATIQTVEIDAGAVTWAKLAAAVKARIITGGF